MEEKSIYSLEEKELDDLENKIFKFKYQNKTNFKWVEVCTTEEFDALKKKALYTDEVIALCFEYIHYIEHLHRFLEGSGIPMKEDRRIALDKKLLKEIQECMKQ